MCLHVKFQILFFFSIELFIEDENSCRGPMRMEVDGESTVGELRRKVETEFGIGGRNQASSDSRSLSVIFLSC